MTEQHYSIEDLFAFHCSNTVKAFTLLVLLSVFFFFFCQVLTSWQNFVCYQATGWATLANSITAKSMSLLFLSCADVNKTTGALF